MNGISTSIGADPFAGVVPVVLLIVAGLLLWAAGRRVLRGGFAAVGLVVGGSAGWVMGQAWELDVLPWIPALIGGLIAAILAVLVYRMALATALAGLCAIAGPVMVVTVGEMRGLTASDAASTGAGDQSTPAWNEGKKPEPDDASGWLSRDPAETIGLEQLEGLAEAGIEGLGLGEEASARLGHAATRLEQLAEEGSAWWQRTPPALRPAIIAAALTGGLVGILLAALAPAFGASIVSSFGGSLLWLGGGRVLVAGTGVAGEGWIPTSAAIVLAVWLITALVGIAIQWTFRPGPADTST